MTDAPLAFLPDLVEEHLDELGFLWAQRKTAVTSPKYLHRDVVKLEARIEAHLEGLLVPGEALLDFAKPGLEGDDADAAFAAAFSLLRARVPGAPDAVWAALESATPARARGLADALAWAPSDALLPRLDKVSDSGAPHVSLAAATVLALRRRVPPSPRAREGWLAAEDAEVRRAAWRLAALAGAAETRALWEGGLADADPGVRREARRAALWCRQRWVLDGARSAIVRGREAANDEVVLVAAVGDANDLPGLLAYAKDGAYGPARFRPIGVLGHPGGGELLLKAMGGLDLLASAFAGEAFAKLTGEDVESGRRTVVPPEGGGAPDAFEQEFLDEMALPDERKARAAWERRRAEYAKGGRWCRGHDVSRPPAPEVLAALDRESLWELRLRGALDGTGRARAADFEAYPQGPAAP